MDGVEVVEDAVLADAAAPAKAMVLEANDIARERVLGDLAQGSAEPITIRRGNALDSFCRLF